MKRVLIQVKSGKVGAKEIREFLGILERENATLGFFITLNKPTKQMLKEAEQAGVYTSPLGWVELPRLQIRTIKELLEGNKFLLLETAPLVGVNRAQEHRTKPDQPALGI